MVKIHELKLKESFCDDVLNGRKNFEIRLNDRGFQTGDHVKFSRVTELGSFYPGHEIEKQEYVITYVLSGWGIKENMVVFGIKPLEGVMELEKIEPRKANCITVPLDNNSVSLDITCPWCNEPLRQSDNSRYCRMCGKPIIMLTQDEQSDMFDEYWRKKNDNPRENQEGY